MIPALEQVIADHKHAADVLRGRGHAVDAEQIEKVLRDVETACVDYLRKLNEEDAMFRSGKSRDWLRARFAEWMATGNAGFDLERPRERWYRQIVLPLRANRDAARDAGRRGERLGR